VGPQEDHDELGHLAQLAAATTNPSLEVEVDRMADMLEKLVAVLARSNLTEPARRPLRSKVGPRRWGLEGNPSMLGMWRLRTSP